MESYRMRMGQGGGRLPVMAGALPPLPRSRLGKSTASSGENSQLLQQNWTDHTFNMNLNGYENGKNILYDEEATATAATETTKQDESQLPDSDKDLNAEAKRLRRSSFMKLTFKKLFCMHKYY